MTRCKKVATNRSVARCGYEGCQRTCIYKVQYFVSNGIASVMHPRHAAALKNAS